MSDVNLTPSIEKQSQFGAEKLDAPYCLPAVPYLRLRFSLIAQKEAFLPSFKGSLLRGAFGHALRRTLCALGPRQPCPTCMLRK